MKDYFKLRAIRESLGMAQVQKENTDSLVASQDPNRSGHAAIDALYENEKQKWANSEYGKEDIARLFTEEHLASLSVEDYALLMKRFPSEMVTHVTRQGIRDHTGMFEHTGGEGSFQNGFEKMLDDGNLKSPLAIKFMEKSKGDAVLDCIRSRGGELPKDREEALRQLQEFIENGWGGYTDQSAIHFATEEVADYYYGSEKGNEIFVAYPSAFIGSQYHFSRGGIAAKPTGGSRENDAWVLTEEERGIKLDAGLVFLPREARVDPRNGSRYEIGPDTKPVKNEAAYQSLQRLAASPEFATLSARIQERLGSLSAKLPPPSTWENELSRDRLFAYAHQEIIEALLPIRDKIKETSGITDDRILEQIFNYSNIGSLASARDEMERMSVVGKILEQSGTRFVEAHHTVSSEEYWNQYFIAHPGKKPSKIVFYSGDNPTKAVMDWRRRYGLDKRSSDANAGFSERRVVNQTDHTQVAPERLSRFETLARSIIEEKYPIMPTPKEQSVPVPEDFGEYGEPPPLPGSSEEELEAWRARMRASRPPPLPPTE